MDRTQAYVGQRVVIARTEDNRPGVPVRARIISLDPHRVWDGRTADVKVSVEQSATITSSNGEAIVPSGYEASCWLYMLDPFVPEGYAPANWKDCLWNPSMLKENNQ